METQRKAPVRVVVLVLLFGVVLPAIAVGVEATTGFCAANIFDPVPTPWHLLLVALVPAANLLLWIEVFLKRRAGGAWQGPLNGLATGVAAVYAIVFIPLTPIAAVGVLWFGLGLLPLSPLLSATAGLTIHGQRRRIAAAEGRARPAGFARGLVGALALLLVVQLPSALTRASLHLAASEDPGTSRLGIRILRLAGDEDTLLRSCYWRSRLPDLLELVVSPVDRVGVEEARTIYYKVRGRSFSQAPRPRTKRSFWTSWWDEDRGGDTVGATVERLSLVSSRMDGTIHPDLNLGYLEWTLVFRNRGPRQEEARAQIDLPPGGVVTRLTLWIDGQEREAAFGGRAQVKSAYKQVVQRRRDPVLVTTKGPDRIMLQCFPVPPRGDMKVRVGIVVPLGDEHGSAPIRLPSFVERNFAVPRGLRHSLWVESRSPLQSRDPGIAVEDLRQDLHQARGFLDDATLRGHHLLLAAVAPAAEAPVVVTDPLGPSGLVIKQRFAPVSAIAPTRLVLVVDASATMKNRLDELVAALDSLPAGIPLDVLAAGDEVLRMPPDFPGGGDDRGRAAAWLRSLGMEGGRDNVPALAQGIDLAVRNPGALVLWVHGPQPVLLEPPENLYQVLQRWRRRVTICDLQVAPGVDRIAEELECTVPLERVYPDGGLAAALARLSAGWTGDGGLRMVPVRERIPAGRGGAPAPGGAGATLLARLWAAEEATRLLHAGDGEDAAKLSVAYQVVTPVSGAVVLETAAQYAAAGLEPVDPGTVPTIPEPETWLMAALALVLLVAAMRSRLRRPSWDAA